MALEQITFNIGAFNDSDAGGNNYFTDTVFEVKNQSDNTFATIYADSSGTTQIPQNGIDNVSNSRGECNFYIDDGDFYIEVDSQQKNFNTGNFKTDFANIDEVKAYSKLSKLIGQRIITGEYHSGTGYGGASYDVVSSGSVTPNGIDIIQGVADSGAAIVLNNNGVFIAEQYGWPEYAQDAMNTATLRAQAANIGKVSFSQECFNQTDTIILRGGVVIEGATNGKYGQIKMAASAPASVRQVETEDFEADLINKPAEVLSGLKSDTGLVNVFLNSNKIGRTGAISDWKEGITLAYYGIRPIFRNLRIQRSTGIGWYSKFDRGQIADFKAVLETDTIGSSVYNVNIADTAYESIIFEGPSDIRMDYIVAGWAANSLYDTTYDSSKESLRYPGEDIRGVVFDRFGAEVGYLHAFDNHHGRAFDVINTRDNERVRMKFSHLMGGGSFGNIRFGEHAAIQCGVLDSHNCTGGDGSRPHIEIASAGSPFGCSLPSIEVFRGGVENGANSILVSGTSNDIGLTVYGKARQGHGVVIEGSNNSVSGVVDGVQGLAFDGNLSSALVTSSGSFNNTVDLTVAGCDRVWDHNGTSRVGRVNISGRLNDTSTAFSGLESIPSDEWATMSATNYNTGGSEDTLSAVRELISVDNTVTTEQSFTVNFNLSRTPGKSDVLLSLSTQSGQTGSVEYIKVNSVSSTSADVRVKFSAAGTGTSFVALSIY